MQNRTDIITKLRVDGDDIDGKLTQPAIEAQAALEGITDEARKSNPALELLSQTSAGFAEGLEDIPILGSAIQKLGPVGVAASVGIGVAAAAVKGLIEISQSARDAVREIATEADNLGISTGGFQALRVEAVGANIDINTLQSSLTGFQSRVAELSLGKGELADRLAPATAETINNAATFEGKIDALAAALQDARNETEFMTIATAAFGESGVETGRFLRDNIDTLGDLQAEYSQLGVIISETQIRAIEGNARMIETLKTVSDGLSDQITSNLEPIGTAIEARILRQIISVKSAFASLTGPGRFSPRRSLKELGTDIDDVTARLETLKAAAAATPNQTFFLTPQIRAAQRDLEKLIETQEEAQKAVERPFVGPVDPVSGVPGDFVVASQPDIDEDVIKLVNRLKEQALTLDEKRTKAIRDYEAALAAGVRVTKEEDAAIRASIANRFKDTAAIRAQQQAVRDKAKDDQDQIRLDQQAARIQAQLGDVTAAVAAKRQELNQIAEKTNLSQAQVNQAVQDYERRLTGADRAQRELESAMRKSLDIHQLYAADVAKLETAQAKANIPEEEFNQILAARNKLYQDQIQQQAEARQREDFGGETLAEAGERIKASLQTATEVIDAKIDLERKIVEALVSEGALSSEDAATRLTDYRKELENAADKTNELSDAQRALNGLVNDATQGMNEFEKIAVQALVSLIFQTDKARGELGGLGGLIEGIFGGQSSGGGFFEGLFGGGGSGGGILASIFHSGTKSVGKSSGPTRSVPAALFAGAPRFHNGTANVGSDEVAAILRKGERVSTESEMRDMVAAINSNTLAAANDSSGRGLNLTIINQGEPLTGTAEDRGLDEQGRQELVLMLNRVVDERVPSALSNKASQNVLAQQYGVRRQTGGRR